MEDSYVDALSQSITTKQSVKTVINTLKKHSKNNKKNFPFFIRPCYQNSLN